MATLGNVLQARVLTIFSPQIGLNILHYKVIAQTGAGATNGVIATAIDNAIAAVYKACIANASTYRGVGVRNLSLIADPETPSVVNSGFGTGGANMVPTQVCGILHISTLNSGRSGRGRMYMPFLPTGFLQANGEQTAAYSTALNALGTVLATPISAGGGGNTVAVALCILKRATGATTNATAVTATGKLATQRRRGDYGRTNIPPF